MTVAFSSFGDYTICTIIDPLTADLPVLVSNGKDSIQIISVALNIGRSNNGSGTPLFWWLTAPDAPKDGTGAKIFEYGQMALAAFMQDYIHHEFTEFKVDKGAIYYGQTRGFDNPPAGTMYQTMVLLFKVIRPDSRAQILVQGG